jgi:hypothetical protein
VKAIGIYERDLWQVWWKRRKRNISLKVEIRIKGQQW